MIDMEREVEAIEDAIAKKLLDGFSREDLVLYVCEDFRRRLLIEVVRKPGERNRTSFFNSFRESEKYADVPLVVAEVEGWILKLRDENFVDDGFKF